MQSHQDVYRFSVETVPFDIEEFPDSQPVLLLLLNENHGLVIGMELMPEAPDVAQAGEWILKQLAGSGAGSEVEPAGPALLRVEDAELYQALRFRLRRAGLKVQHDPERQLVESILSELYEGLGSGPQPASLIQVLGEQEALDWARAALTFARRKPWKQFREVLECQVPGRPQPYGVYVMGSGETEFGLLLLEKPELPLHPDLDENFAYLVGFSLSPEAMIHPQDLALFQAYRLQKSGLGWPHFVFCEPCSDEDEAVFRWLLTAVPQLAQAPLDPYTDKSGFVLRDPQARQRDDWENFEAYCKSFQAGRLTKSRRQLLEVLYEFLLHAKYEEGLEMATLLADCRILARQLWGERPSNWRKRLSEGAVPAAPGCDSTSLAETWDLLGRYLKTQEIYFGPSVPLLLLGAALAKVRQEEGWKERIAVSQDMAKSALEGITAQERLTVVQTWRRWLKELSEKYLDRESLFLDPREMNQARLATDQFMQQLEGE